MDYIQRGGAPVQVKRQSDRRRCDSLFELDQRCPGLGLHAVEGCPQLLRVGALGVRVLGNKGAAALAASYVALFGEVLQ